MQQNKFKICERVWRGGDNITAYDILAPIYKSSIRLDKQELGKHALEEVDPEFASKSKNGEYEIVVAGLNFRGGAKSIEHPVYALLGAGIRLVVASSFARYFFRNAIIDNITKGITMKGEKLNSLVLDILSEGGYMPYTLKKIRK